MDLYINLIYDENSIHNIAFIKALLIKFYIESLDINYNKKVELKNMVLCELQKTHEKE